MTMKRRRFLELGAAGIAAAGIPGTVLAATSNVTALNDPNLLRVLHSRSAVRRIGESYRKAYPHEDDADVLRTEILREAGAHTRAAVEDRVRCDFEEARIVRVHGWILSRTEARQCALFSLERL